MSEIDRAVSLTNELYGYHLAGGPLHIITDDGNLENSHIRYCWEYVNMMKPGEHVKETQELSREILKLLARMNFADRNKYYAKVWNQDCDIDPFELEESEDE